MGRDVGPTDILLSQIPMEPLQAIIDAGAADGLWEHLYEGDYSKVADDFIRNAPIPGLGMLGYGISSYPVPAINTRSDFRDVIAQGDYNKQWTELSPLEQRKLERKYKTQFETLDKKVAIERVDRPINVDRIKEEERAAGEQIRRKLTEENRLKLQGISIGLSRYPGDFYLNDERFNRYQQLVVEDLNNTLSKFNKTNDKILAELINRSKKKAWVQLRREIK